MKKISFLLVIVCIAFIFLPVSGLQAQGCVAIRSTGGMACDMHHPGDTTSKWLFAVNNRYYKSYKHFIGTAEQKQRQVLGNEVINHAYTMDLSITHNISDRW